MTLQELLMIHHKPELAEKVGMVYQVWEDGEVTLQKCGPLLWQRNLHIIDIGNKSKAVDPTLFPCQYNGHGYIFTDETGVKAVRDFILS